jgi:ubiquinone/menaquinone biosynthesis C-methylase UbiE
MRKFYYWMIANIGIDPKSFIGFFINIPRFVSDYVAFKKLHNVNIELWPYLNDRKSSAGSFMHEYFIQDVFAAQLVHRLNPQKIVDVGSRIDGYIAHLITSREVELIDIRPMDSVIKNLKFLQMNFSDYESVKENYTDFVSCLHSIEHFGLGRYGDPIVKDAVPSALKSFSRITKPNGAFLLSTTFGKERVKFNAQWIFDFNKMKDQLEALGFVIEELYYLDNTTFKIADANTINAITAQHDALVLMLCRKHP